jgi:hypothetical protein
MQRPYVIAGAVLLFMVLIMTTKKSRAERNNNPGNVRPIGGSGWKGQIGIDSKAGGPFAIFDFSYNGYRAMGIDIYGDITKDGTNTIRKVITEYAPPSENVTKRYVEYVSKRMQLNPDSVLNVYLHGPDLLRIMADYESGTNSDKAFGKENRLKGHNLALKYLGL